MATRYCEESDVYSYGLPRASVANPGRLAQSADPSTNTITLNVHGFAEGSAVRFRADAAGGSLPGGIAEGTTYYVQIVDADRFRVSTTAGGSVVDITSAGLRLIVIPDLTLTPEIEWASALIDDALPAHLVPLEAPYPPIVRMTCAELAARKRMVMQGAVSESVATFADEAIKRVQRWAKGVPLRGENVTNERRANLAASSASAPRADRSGWGRFGGIR